MVRPAWESWCEALVGKPLAVPGSRDHCLQSHFPFPIFCDFPHSFLAFLFHLLPLPLVVCAPLAPLPFSGQGSWGQHRLLLCGLGEDESPG